eukprot:1144300-Pelagomonas_calceolata.AAC.2
MGWNGEALGAVLKGSGLEGLGQSVMGSVECLRHDCKKRLPGRLHWGLTLPRRGCQEAPVVVSWCSPHSMHCPSGRLPKSISDILSSGRLPRSISSGELVLPTRRTLSLPRRLPKSITSGNSLLLHDVRLILQPLTETTTNQG